MSNKGKFLVIRVKLGEDADTKWIWDSLISPNLKPVEINGVTVTAMSWTDLFKHECEDLEDDDANRD